MIHVHTLDIVYYLCNASLCQKASYLVFRDLYPTQTSRQSLVCGTIHAKNNHQINFTTVQLFERFDLTCIPLLNMFFRNFAYTQILYLCEH